MLISGRVLITQWATQEVLRAWFEHKAFSFGSTAQQHLLLSCTLYQNGNWRLLVVLNDKKSRVTVCRSSQLSYGRSFLCSRRHREEYLQWRRRRKFWNWHCHNLRSLPERLELSTYRLMLTFGINKRLCDVSVFLNKAKNFFFLKIVHISM